MFPLETAYEIKTQFDFLPTQMPLLVGWFGLFSPAWHPLVRGPTVGNILLLFLSVEGGGFLPTPQTVPPTQITPAGLFSWTQHQWPYSVPGSSQFAEDVTG